jgi:hypothetical protein
MHGQWEKTLRKWYIPMKKRVLPTQHFTSDWDTDENSDWSTDSDADEMSDWGTDSVPGLTSSSGSDADSN